MPRQKRKIGTKDPKTGKYWNGKRWVTKATYDLQRLPKELTRVPKSRADLRKKATKGEIMEIKSKSKNTPKTTIKPGTPHPRVKGKVRDYYNRWVDKSIYDKQKSLTRSKYDLPSGHTNLKLTRPKQGAERNYEGKRQVFKGNKWVDKKGGAIVKRPSSAITKRKSSAITKAKKAAIQKFENKGGFLTKRKSSIKRSPRYRRGVQKVNVRVEGQKQLKGSYTPKRITGSPEPKKITGSKSTPKVDFKSQSRTAPSRRGKSNIPKRDTSLKGRVKTKAQRVVKGIKSSAAKSRAAGPQIQALRELNRAKPFGKDNVKVRGKLQQAEKMRKGGPFGSLPKKVKGLKGLRKHLAKPGNLKALGKSNLKYGLAGVAAHHLIERPATWGIRKAFGQSESTPDYMKAVEKQAKSKGLSTAKYTRTEDYKKWRSANYEAYKKAFPRRAANLEKKKKAAAKQTTTTAVTPKKVVSKTSTTSPPTTKPSTPKKVVSKQQPVVNKSQPKKVVKKKKISERDAWLKRTANSPAASAGFTDDERWALQQKHRAWKKKHNRR